MIFDRFPSPADAERFAAHAIGTLGLRAHVHYDAASAHRCDPFPWALDIPVVHVERSDDLLLESLAENAAPVYGGVFAGT